MFGDSFANVKDFHPSLSFLPNPKQSRQLTKEPSFVNIHVSEYLRILFGQRLLGLGIGSGSFCRVGPAKIRPGKSCRIGSVEPVYSKTNTPNR